MAIDPQQTSQTINDSAKRGVQVYQSDQERVEQHSLDGQIKADKYLRMVQDVDNNANRAARIRGMFLKIRPV